MKKFIIMLLAALMIVGLCVSCKEPEPKPTFSFVGKWETTYVEEGETVVTILELKADKSFTMDVSYDGTPVPSLSGIYEITEDERLVIVLDEESAATQVDENITDENPLYVVFKDATLAPGTETVLMGTMQSKLPIDDIVDQKLKPNVFTEYELEDTTLSVIETEEDYFIVAHFTPNEFGDGVTRIDYDLYEGVLDDSGDIVNSLKTAGFYDAEYVNKGFIDDEHTFYIFCKAVKENITEFGLSSAYEIVDLTHFKATLGSEEEQIFTKK